VQYNVTIDKELLLKWNFKMPLQIESLLKLGLHLEMVHLDNSKITLYVDWVAMHKLNITLLGTE